MSQNCATCGKEMILKEHDNLEINHKKPEDFWLMMTVHSFFCFFFFYSYRQCLKSLQSESVGVHHDEFVFRVGLIVADEICVALILINQRKIRNIKHPK